MSALRLFCCLGAAAAIAAAAHPARADEPRKRAAKTASANKKQALRTDELAPLHTRPAESSRVLTRLPKGTPVKVLERSGRWLYVRVGEQRGWLTRTTVARSRGTAKKRHYRAEAWALDDDRAAAAAGPEVASRDTAAAMPAPERDAELEKPATPPPPLRDPRIAATAAVGYRSLGTDFSSNGSAGTGNYLIDMVALTTAVGGRARLLPRGAFAIEVDGEYRFTYGRPGIHYASSSGAAGDIPFIQHQIDAGATVGVWTRPAGHRLQLAARGGYHYGAFLVDDVDNVGLLASESLAGPVAGARLRLQPHGSSYQLRAGIDAMVGGSRQQTEGLEDGMSSSASAIWGRAGANLPLSAGLELELAYRYERAATSWSGPSPRQPDVTTARRIDTSHIAFIGIGRSF